jgi:glycerol-3-phosphate cytidylyltransferase
MKVGVVAGNFDVIHPGYMQMFAECKANCDIFEVFLHEDPSIGRSEKIKPILSVEERMEILYGIRYIDSVVPYKTEQDLYQLLKVSGVHVRFLGDDYIGKRYTGDDLGIPIHWIKRDHGWSTTKFKTLIAQSIPYESTHR